VTTKDGKTANFAKHGISSKYIVDDNGTGVGMDSKANFVYSG